MNFNPDLFTFSDGSKVMCTNCWKRRRKEILEILSREEYGRTPEKPEWVRGEELSSEGKCCSGHAELLKLQITFPAEKGEFAFPILLFKNVVKEKAPLILLINFRPDAYDMYFPAEEIIDHGFNLAVLYYEDVTKDNGDLKDGLAGMYERRNDGTDWGKIGMWAFAASRAMDYLSTLPFIDSENATVIGHSRLGKTALWCGAQDERFKFVVSNDSGCGGAAYEREKHGSAETVDAITTTFPFWFCENYRGYAGKAESMPFDQHFLLSLVAPRFLLVGSAEDDLWADPLSEELSCRAVTPVWALFGLPGYIGPEGRAKPGEDFSEGSVAYHIRDGIHFLGRPDWLRYLAFIEKHI